MAGVFFIVNVPNKVYELELRKKDCHQKPKSEYGTYNCSGNNVPNDIVETSEEKKHETWIWDNIKHAVKSKKKLRISENTENNLQSTLHQDTPLETILAEIIIRSDIKNATWNTSRDDKIWQVTFSLQTGNQCEELIQVLRTFGIGTRHQSSVSMIPCTLYFKAHVPDKCEVQNDCQDLSDVSAWQRFSSSVSARVNLSKILEDVRAEAALTFDWMFLLIVAAFVAALGLVENSTVILVASMLISPLMGPITAATLGTAVKDRSLQKMGVLNELLGLFLCVVMGFLVGLSVCAIDESYGVGDWPTYEMTSRCELRALWVGVLVALPSGAGVALAILGDYTASLVGVAISAALLPPAVNAGLFWAISLVHLVFLDDETRWVNVVKTEQFSKDHATELAVFGAISLCLTLINIICIFIAGVIVYKVKEVCPPNSSDITRWINNNKRPNRASRILGKLSKQDPHLPWDIYNYASWNSSESSNRDSTSNGKTEKNPSDLSEVSKNTRDTKENENKKETRSDLESKFTFQNLAFEDTIHNSNEISKPTPHSTTVTIDCNKNAVLLANNTIDV